MNNTIATKAKEKLSALEVSVQLLEVKVEEASIGEAETAYNGLDATKKAIVDKTFKNYVSGGLAGVEAYIAIKRNELAKAEEAEIKANKEETIKLAKQIKEAIAALPTANQFKNGEFTDAQYNSMNNLVKADGTIDKLLDLYVTLGVIAARPTTSEAKTNALVTGHRITGDNPNTDDVEEFYQDPEIGDFSAEGERELLNKVYSLPDAYDENVANKVIELVELLPGARLLTLEDAAQVEAARKAYDKLTPAQKALADAYTSTNYIPENSKKKKLPIKTHKTIDF